MATEAGAEVRRATARARPDQLRSLNSNEQGLGTRPQRWQVSQILTVGLMVATRKALGNEASRTGRE